MIQVDALQNVEITSHAITRACQRIFGMYRPTIRDRVFMYAYVRRNMYWCKFRRMFVIHSWYMDKYLRCIVQDNKVVTIRPI